MAKGRTKRSSGAERRTASTTPPPIRPEAWIASVAPDAADLPDVRVLVGIPGESSAGPQSMRLYLALDLSEYVEVARRDVVHVEPLGDGQSVLSGGTLAWVRRSARLRIVRPTQAQNQTDFLQGEIAAQHLRATGAGGIAALGRGTVFSSLPCFTITLVCISLLLSCWPFRCPRPEDGA